MRKLGTVVIVVATVLLLGCLALGIGGGLSARPSFDALDRATPSQDLHADVQLKAGEQRSVWQVGVESSTMSCSADSLVAAPQFVSTKATVRLSEHGKRYFYVGSFTAPADGNYRVICDDYDFVVAEGGSGSAGVLGLVGASFAVVGGVLALFLLAIGVVLRVVGGRRAADRGPTPPAADTVGAAPTGSFGDQQAPPTGTAAGQQSPPP